MAHQSNESPAWGALKSAYGSAEEVGELLGLIESGEDVWGDLIGEVLHQGSLYGATAPAIAVVIGLLSRGALSKRPASPRRGEGRGQVPSQRAWAFVFLAGAATSATQTEKGTRLAADVLKTLREGCALYDAGLTDQEVGVRHASAAVWKVVADDGALAFASIAKGYEHETDRDVRVTMLSALNALAGTGRKWLDRLLLILGSATSIPEKFYAAAYLTIRLGVSTPEDVANQLAKSYADLPEAGVPVEVTNIEEPEDLYWAAVCAIKRSRGVACLATTLEMCRGTDGFGDETKVMNIVERLLRLASNDKRRGWGCTGSSRGPRGPKIEYGGVEPASKASRWMGSPEGRAALNAIVDKTEVWRIETNLLSLFGLPSGRKELRELVRGLPPPGFA
jgi:hypothetical protein